MQAVTEEVILRLTRSLAREHGLDNLCLAGGVALNCVANGKLLRDGAFRNIWVQPAAGDAGGAVGAALAVWHQFLGKRAQCRRRARSDGGRAARPRLTNRATSSSRLAQGRRQIRRSSPTMQVIEDTATSLAAGEAVGWMQGRMEFGPRALGARSILGDPRSPSDAEAAQSAHQVSRELPAVRARGAARGRRRLVRARRRLALHAARRRRRAASAAAA